jgi:hypothetical protein
MVVHDFVPGKHNRKAGRKRRAGAGGGIRQPCPLVKKAGPSAKKQARMREIALRLEASGVLDSASVNVGEHSSSNTATQGRRRPAVALLSAVTPDAEDDLFSLGLPPPPSTVPSRPHEPVVRKKPVPRVKTVPTGELKASASADVIEALRMHQSPYEDQHQHCRDCGQRFVFTIDQQQQLAQRGFQNPKKTRCNDCAKFKKNRFSARGASHVT